MARDVDKLLALTAGVVAALLVVLSLYRPRVPTVEPFTDEYWPSEDSGTRQRKRCRLGKRTVYAAQPATQPRRRCRRCVAFASRRRCVRSS
jgi:hypothetical protein